MDTSRIIATIVVVALLVSCNDSRGPCDSLAPAPSFTNTAPIVLPPPDTSGVVGDTLWLITSAYDSDGDDVALSISVLPADTAFPAVVTDATRGAFWFVPGPAHYPSCQLTITATDPFGASSTGSFSISVVQYVWDQSNEDAGNSWLNISWASPLGQEFTPTKPQMNIAQILIRDATGGGLGPVDFALRVRSGNIAGPVIGTSLATFRSGEDGMATFEFDSTLTLTPGQLYVLELEHLVGMNWGILPDDGNHYAGGRMIFQGRFSPSRDLVFRQGLKLSEPSPFNGHARGHRR